MNDELHVLFGAGQVGQSLAQRLLAAGKRVRIARRSSQGIPPGTEAMAGDAADPAFCLRAAEGATVVYHCMNPPYDAAVWAEVLPRLMRNLIAAAGRAQARLVVLDNLYMLGRPQGSRIDELSPISPCSRKGEVRAEVAELLFAAHRRGEVQATVGRASDFYGPGGAATFVGDHFWPAALAGKTVRLPFDPDAVHTYHYIPDVAAGLAALGGAEADVCGRPWMLPCAPAGSLRQLVARFAPHLVRDIHLARIPGWVLGAAAVFSPLLREVNEMRYQWQEPFVVEDSRFRARFGLAPGDADEAASATVAWARQHYA